MYQESVKDQPLRKFQKVNEIIGKHGKDRASLIPILQEVQEEFRYLPEEMLSFIGTAMGISPADVYGVATFYAQFSVEPKGKHLIQVCDGTACHVKNSSFVLEKVRKKLELEEGQQTTEDLLATVETVACIGACALAPAIMIDGKIYGHLTPESVEVIVDDLIKNERSATNA